MNIGKAIKQLRKQQRYTQEQLGELVGVSKWQISQIEGSKRGFSKETISNITDVLKVSLTALNVLAIEYEDMPPKYQDDEMHRLLLDTGKDILVKQLKID